MTTRLLDQAEVLRQSAANKAAWNKATTHIATGVDGAPYVVKSKPVKPSKYKNVKTEVDGIKFDSKKEAKRWQELRALQKAGQLRDLAHQWKYFLIPPQTRSDGKKERAVDYIADFAYVDLDGVTHVEDVKSPSTRKLPAYIIKRKLMLQVHGISIKEI